MRRSLAPSQFKKYSLDNNNNSNSNSNGNERVSTVVYVYQFCKNILFNKLICIFACNYYLQNGSSRNQKKNEDDDDEIVIERMPLFGFLSIPENLNKQFKIPTGCKISAA